jgi:hypothetical protein
MKGLLTVCSRAFQSPLPVVVLFGLFASLAAFSLRAYLARSRASCVPIAKAGNPIFVYQIQE